MYLRRTVLIPLAFAAAIWPAVSGTSAAHSVERTAHAAQSSYQQGYASPYQDGYADGYAGGYARAWNYCTYALPWEENREGAYWKGYWEGWDPGYGDGYDKHCHP